MENNELGNKKIKGRKSQNQKKGLEINKEQTKFFVDFSNEKESLNLIFNFLEKCNDKSYGRLILFKDLCQYALSKLNNKDIDKIKDQSLSEMEKVELALIEHNKKTGQALSLGEFLVKRLGIN